VTIKSKTSSKDHICEVALATFARLGYGGANVAQIAADAGVSQPTIHYHFKSKRALWEAAMHQLGASLTSSRQSQQELYGFLSPLDKLKAACVLLIEEASRGPVLGQVILSEGQAGGERLEWLLRNVLFDVYQDFLEVVETCVHEGLIKPYKGSHLLMLLTGAAVTQFNVSPLVSSVFGEDPREQKNVTAFKEMYLDVLFAGLTINKEE